MAHGCFYRLANSNQSALKYLPQIGLDAHATILATNSRTLITQTFINPSATEAISEVFYSFPLYESSSIVGFTCRLGDTVIEGVVQPKEKAKQTYQEAKSKGKTAAILHQSLGAADVFSTRLGNVPAGGTVLVEITLIQELSQDAKTDGIRYTIPVTIGPRYGRGDGSAGVPEGVVVKTAIKVDVVMEKGSNIRNIRSPSHPIQVDLGRTSDMPQSIFESYYASIQLEDNVAIDEDFVLTVNADKQDLPFAFLEAHPTLPNQRALMVSLVPKFSLPPDSSEIVFVIDRSGSMEDKIPTLRSALELFLKSLPLGVPFNLVSFGTSHETLWPRSKVSSTESLKEALTYTKKIRADLGGTEMMSGLQAAVENRYQDKVLEVLVLTDGEVWNQHRVFDLVNRANQENSARFFTLGLGNSVSHSLINGIARAGKGFSQTVLNNEDLNKTVIRMLKGALMPRLHNSKLDVNIPEFKEDYVEVEPARSDRSDTEPLVQPISLFEQDHKEEEIVGDVRGPLPKLAVPSILQAPADLPALFPFIRSNIYLLFSQPTDSVPETITLRANSKHGPLSLDIPVQDIGKGQTLHQLAAKKTITELEESRGWIYSARDTEGELVRSKWESRIDELVQKECERLGVMFQIAGKHCSFVAVNDNTPVEYEKDPGRKFAVMRTITERQAACRMQIDSAFNLDFSAQENPEILENFDFNTFLNSDADASGFGFVPNATPSPKRKKAKRSWILDSCAESYSPMASFGSATSPNYIPTSPTLVPTATFSPTGTCSGYVPTATTPSFSPTSPGYSPVAFGVAVSSTRPLTNPSFSPDSPSNNEEDDDEGTGSTPALPLNKLIHLQTFEGFWEISDALFRIVGLDPSTTRTKIQSDYESLAENNTNQTPVDEKWSRLIATCLVCQFLEMKETASKDVWELVKTKADGWVQAETDALETADREVIVKLLDGLGSFF